MLDSAYEQTWVYTSLFLIVGLRVSLSTFTVYQLAEKTGHTTTEIGSTLFVYGIGLFFGLCAMKIKSVSIDMMLIAVLTISTAALVLIPFNTSLELLYIFQFIMGFDLAMVETGSMILIRKIQGKNAGVWLGLTGSCLSLGFFIVPIIMSLTNDNIYWEYIFVAVISAIALGILTVKYITANTEGNAEGEAVVDTSEVDVAIELKLVPTEEKQEKDKEDEDESITHHHHHHHHQLQPDQKQHYHVEITICLIFIIFVGMENSIGVYLQQYLDESIYLNTIDKNTYQLVFIICSSLSKLCVPIFQWYYPQPLYIRRLLYICNIINFLCILIWCLSSSAIGVNEVATASTSNDSKSESGSNIDVIMFFVFLSVNGLSSGGTMSLIYDVCNSLTIANRASTIILTSGIYIGSSLYPWFLSITWESLGSDDKYHNYDRRYEVYPYSTLIMASIVMVVCPILPSLSYLKEQSLELKQEQEQEPIVDVSDTETANNGG
jgi:hypothetical protein